ncbi:MAG: SpoIIE family protein phosphatase, partial [Anaerolineales bacterium]|nr:SpoIIE family protein phosphatase [Anaerolineales bacterium]
GGVDYITKPFQLEEVLVRTQTHLALRTLQKRLQETNQKFEREFLLAGELQANFMPSKLPVIDGWQLAAEIIPARETSGDFFDVFELPDGLLGFLVADVVDKGVSAALFMVLSWSLIRTYAAEYPTQPEQVFAEVNRRILADIGAQQYVTIFYGVLNPANGQLIYSNAGHPPPLLFNPDSPDEQRKLVRTGIPLGIFEDAAWENQIIPLAPGDSLVVCTDGITEAQNPGGDFFGEERLFTALQASGGAAAEDILKNVLTNVESFTQLAHQYDDIAAVVLQRDGH